MFYMYFKKVSFTYHSTREGTGDFSPGAASAITDRDDSGQGPSAMPELLGLELGAWLLTVAQSLFMLLPLTGLYVMRAGNPTALHGPKIVGPAHTHKFLSGHQLGTA